MHGATVKMIYRVIQICKNSLCSWDLKLYDGDWDVMPCSLVDVVTFKSNLLP